MISHTSAPSGLICTALSLGLLLGCSDTAAPVAADPAPDPVAPVLRVVELGRGSSLLSLSNPSHEVSTREFTLCPIAAESFEDGEWQHSGYLMTGGGEYCSAPAMQLLPGAEHRFWLRQSLPFDGHLLRLGVQVGELALPAERGTWVYTDPVAPPQ